MNRETMKIMFSSRSGNWRTPQDLFNQIDEEHHFTLDVCADQSGGQLKAGMKEFFGTDGLTQSWIGNICYMNPPYGREITKWIEKAWLEMTMNNVTTVALLPARTDTKWFWDYCIKQEIRLIKGRIRFLNDDKDEMPAPFPSLIVVFKP